MTKGTPYAQRKTPMLSLTVPSTTRDRLSIMATADGSKKSALVAELIEDEWERRELERDGEARVAEVRARNKRARS